MNQLKTRSLVLTGLMTAVMCILGPLTIMIPVSPVPLSLTTMAVYFSAILLGWKKGTISCLVYLLIGFAGVPVFSNFSAGPSKLLGPTGGYLIGFVFMALITGFFVDRFKGRTLMVVLGMVLGTLVTYALGTSWLAYQANLTFQGALFAGVVPYIPGDMVKMAIAAINGPVIKRRLEQHGYL